MSDTILVVNDDTAQRHMAEFALVEKLKYQVVSVGNAQEAIDRVLSNRLPMPDVMLLDMRMPGVDGLQIIRAVKAQRPDFPIIIITEYGDHENATLAVHAGANDFLTKPMSLERLALSITNVLRLRQLHHTLARLEKQLAADGVSLPDMPIQASLNPSLVDDRGKVKKLRTLEEDAIRFALRHCGGSMTRAARTLGIGRSTLYRKVSEMERSMPKVKEGIENYISRANHTTRPMIEVSSIERS